MGSIVGAHLTRAGHEVAMLARGARAQQLRERGITISGLSDFSTPVTTVRDPRLLTGASTLIVATKTPGTAEALAGRSGTRAFENVRCRSRTARSRTRY